MFKLRLTEINSTIPHKTDVLIFTESAFVTSVDVPFVLSSLQSMIDVTLNGIQ